MPWEKGSYNLGFMVNVQKRGMAQSKEEESWYQLVQIGYVLCRFVHTFGGWTRREKTVRTSSDSHSIRVSEDDDGGGGGDKTRLFAPPESHEP